MVRWKETLAARLTGVQVPTHRRGATMFDRPEGATLGRGQLGSCLEELGQETAQRRDDRGGMAAA
jgi:hypothetical protein